MPLTPVLQPLLRPVLQSLLKPVLRGVFGPITAKVFSPLSLFSGGQQGAYYDPSDFTTLFQDAAGTVPVTAVSQPVGLMRDKSGNNNHQSQITAAARPTLKQDAGGKYCLAFDGVDDGMSCATGGGGTAGFFYCAALKPLSTPAGQREIWSDQSGTSGYITVIETAKLRLYSANGTFPFVDAGGTFVAGATDVITVFDDGVNVNAQITDGTVGSAARTVVAAGAAGFALMMQNGVSASYFPGDFYAGIYAKNTGLTPAQRANAKLWVRGKAAR